MPKPEKNFSIKDDSEMSSNLNGIARACEGLTFISEIDSAVRPVLFSHMRDASPGSLRSALQIPKIAPIETVSIEEFFEGLTTVHAWHSQEEARQVKGFARLRESLEDALVELKVFRVGRTRIDIYVLGKTGSGAVAGVHARAVET